MRGSLPAAAMVPNPRHRLRCSGSAKYFQRGVAEHRLIRAAEREEQRPPDLVVIMPLNEWKCSACEGSGGLLIMEGPGPLCLACAEMDHLVTRVGGVGMDLCLRPALHDRHTAL